MRPAHDGSGPDTLRSFAIRNEGAVEAVQSLLRYLTQLPSSEFQGKTATEMELEWRADINFLRRVREDLRDSQTRYRMAAREVEEEIARIDSARISVTEQLKTGGCNCTR